MLCSAHSDDLPMSLVVRRKGDDKLLAETMSEELEFRLAPLKCEDTGVYVCSAQNKWQSSSVEIELSVLCK